MPRNATSAFIQALGEGYLYPVLLLTIQFSSGPVYLSTSYQDLYYLGNTYKGVGSLLEISTIEDGSTVQARGVSVTLSGIDPTLLPACLNDLVTGLPATIYLGLSTYGSYLVSNSVVAWSGRTDQPSITISEKTASITVALESNLMDMNVPVPYRYTNVDQQIFYSGDQGFSWVNAIQLIPIYWGNTSNSDGNP
ncbi:MAG TPA: hypothetical protein VN828_03700 [Acidobacteriaceae bacterium]|nr:hypothetical protein [Acidobacteriaceae bacterium]